MTFLAPLLLWGSLAASIPIILHFFYRSRYQTVPWAAMKFLLAAIEQTSRRLKFQELLLLVLRVCLLLLLALALARPSSTSSGQAGRGDAVDAVLILDQSLSMSARHGVAPPPGGDLYQTALHDYAAPDGTLTGFDRARAAARAIIDQLPPGSTVQVIGCADRAALLGPRDPSRLDLAKKLLDEATLTALGTDFADALRLAGEAVAAGPSPNKEVYLLSDLQRRGFDARSAAVEEALKPLTEKATVTFVRCTPPELANAAIVGLTPQTTLRTGERADFALVLRNTGKKAVRNLTASLTIDGDEKSRETQTVGEIAPGDTRAVVMSVLLTKAGRHVLTATVGPDDLAGDNRFDQIIQVNDQVGVLVVDGAASPGDAKKAGAYFLQHALNPVVANAGVGLPVTTISSGQVAPGDLGGKELCVLVNVPLERKLDRDQPVAPEFLRELATFVQSGKGLLIFGGEKVAPESYNRLLFDGASLLPYRIAGHSPQAKGKEPLSWTFDRTTAQEPPYGRFRGETGYTGLDRIDIRRFLKLDEKKDALHPEVAEESRVLLRYSDGSAAVASRRRPGQGEVLFFTTSVYEEPWSDVYVSPTFVPLVQITVGNMLEGRPAALNRTAGDPLTVAVPAAEAQSSFDVVYPSGRRERLGPPVMNKGRPLVTAPDTPQAGLYRVVAAGREPDEASPLFAVSPDPRETEELDSLTRDEIARRYGDRISVLVAGDGGEAFSGAERLRREWTMWLLAGLLALVLGEMALAWYCGRSW